MSLQQLLSILRARRAVAGLILLATLALALAWVLVRPASYTARAPVLVDVRLDPVAGNPYQGGLAPSFMTTQIDIIRSERVAQAVAQKLPRDQAPMKALWEEASKRPDGQAWLADAISQRLDVKPARESNIINISWTGRTPAEAARVANAFAQAYLDTSLEIKTDPARKYAVWFDEQVKLAREKLEQTQARLSDFQQKAGLFSADVQGDFETERLKELSSQVMASQVRGTGAAAGADGSPLVNNLRAEVARLEAKVQESSATLGPAHPTMQQLQAQVGSLRSRLASESQRVGVTAGASREAGRGRVASLERALADQKTRVLSLNRQRGELNVLQRDVDTAQKAFETVSASAAQSHLQSMTNQTNVMRLAPAVEPLFKNGPSGVLVLLVAAVAGAIFAIVGALMLELVNRRVRSEQDLSVITQLPVLASVPGGRRTAAPMRLPFVPRLRLANRSVPA
ncbi:Wzz/FepE/Etk N-terminal domain-containing protein [Caenimonas sp. SL110]|uniref:Wzz/FepE/Etk N-terminal domain-containing protein n=1 Tax=Caenimonas sp. SL110 TaxID=1450524 RepID=UPI0006529E49|nr:Wzz/FepE/Etk N-terminal domain-containing protein [Caenimonas sp. SL110]